MEWLQILAVSLANASLIVWFRSESRSDWRHMDAKTDAIRLEISAIHQEMKDFHERLLKIEMDRSKK